MEWSSSCNSWEWIECSSPVFFSYARAAMASLGILDGVYLVWLIRRNSESAVLPIVLKVHIQGAQILPFNKIRHPIITTCGWDYLRRLIHIVISRPAFPSPLSFPIIYQLHMPLGSGASTRSETILRSGVKVRAIPPRDRTHLLSSRTARDP